jgi:two-component system CheB/CheR fusion protein
VCSSDLELFDFPSTYTRSRPASNEKLSPEKSSMNIQTLADQLLLQHFAPASVIVNENGDIIYINGHTGKYLEPAVGKANMNIFAMLREGLRNEFPVAFRKAIMKKETVVLQNVKVGTNGNSQRLDINIQWIEKPEPLCGMIMIIFTDVPGLSEIRPKERKGKESPKSIRQTELEKELKYTRSKMQDTLEEMQSSQEELKSSNEELQSTNEELQSTNEELTSSKEEMQSLNEELQTLNAELQSKVDEFSRVNNDMKNLLDSTDIATLFLDKELNIRRFTFQATKIIKLIKGDIGRPFTDLVTDLIYPDLSADALEVLKTLVFIQKPIPTKDGRWFNIRIMPYRTLDDRIDGLVITFINISELKKVELKLHETEQLSNLLFSSNSEILIKLSANLKVTEVNPAAEKFLGMKGENLLDRYFIKLLVPQKERKNTESIINKLQSQSLNGKFKMQVIAAGGTITIVKCSVNMLYNRLKMADGMIISLKK